MRNEDAPRRGYGFVARLGGLWSTLGDVEDPEERQDLVLLAVTIQIRYAGRAARERSLVEFMAVRYAWSSSRTRRRLERLVDLGVLRCSRDLADRWTKVFEVRDRPAVPPPFAVHMGA